MDSSPTRKSDASSVVNTFVAEVAEEHRQRTAAALSNAVRIGRLGVTGAAAPVVPARLPWHSERFPMWQSD